MALIIAKFVPMLNRETALLAVTLLLAPVPLRAEEDLAKIYSDASAQWLDGRPEDAAGALKYVIWRRLR